MKRVILISMLLVSVGPGFGQIKVHSDRHISLGSLTKDWGVQIQPSGYTCFQPSIFNNYGWNNGTVAQTDYTKSYIVFRNGAHKFFVYGNGQIYSNGHWFGSDSSFKTNVQPVRDALIKVLQLRGVYYDLKTDSTSSGGTDPETLNDSTIVAPGVMNSLLDERERPYIGLIAQEVEPVVPELVRTMPDGTKALAYQSIVALLIESIKTQQMELDSIRCMLDQYREELQNIHLQPKNNSSEVKSSQPDYGDRSLLYQNSPNPFNENTTIRYYLCENANSSKIFVFDLQGTMVRSFGLTGHGEGEVIMHGSDLKPGMYIYSLFVDGQEVDTKRMLLTY